MALDAAIRWRVAPEPRRGEPSERWDDARCGHRRRRSHCTRPEAAFRSKPPLPPELGPALTLDDRGALTRKLSQGVGCGSPQLRRCRFRPDGTSPPDLACEVVRLSGARSHRHMLFGLGAPDAPPPDATRDMAELRWHRTAGAIATGLALTVHRALIPPPWKSLISCHGALAARRAFRLECIQRVP